MMGERTGAQEALFDSFNLERHAPADHLLRAIGRFVDLSGMRWLSYLSRAEILGVPNGPRSASHLWTPRKMQE